MSGPSFGSIGRKHHELIGIRDRQTLQQHLIEQGKDRGISADTECEREHHDTGKRRILRQHAQRITNIAENFEIIFSPSV